MSPHLFLESLKLTDEPPEAEHGAGAALGAEALRRLRRLALGMQRQPRRGELIPLHGK